uniref:Magnesium transporter n=1 Tax=Alexandrium monilatum TaxID=311494 RepID=A0A7S4VW19_9DINO|mmetsp:Transcript_56337/g.167585  ORF Transcript_56337/g.167585 Transcript_56337/m.167585 type:complete len:344 (+) Transcript_56337:50-1081(+)
MLLEQWQIGVLTSCLASLLGTLGGQLRVLSHASEGKGGLVWRVRGLLLCGWSLWVMGQALGQLAMVLAPATIIACVAFGSSLLSNAMLAPLVLQEQFTRAHAFGLLLLSAGGCAVTETSAHMDQRYTLDDLVGFGTRLPFLAATAGCLCIALALAARSAQQARLDAWSFAFLFSFVGAVDMLVTKWTLQLLRLQLGALSDEEAPAGPLIVASGIVMVVLHLMVLGFQMVSTRYGEVLLNLPLFLGSGAMMQVALCGTFFNEFDEFSSQRALVFSAGFVLMLVGLGATSRASALEVPLLPLEAPLLAEPEAKAKAIAGPPSCTSLAGDAVRLAAGQADVYPLTP